MMMAAAKLRRTVGLFNQKEGIRMFNTGASWVLDGLFKVAVCWHGYKQSPIGEWMCAGYWNDTVSWKQKYA